MNAVSTGLPPVDIRDLTHHSASAQSVHEGCSAVSHRWRAQMNKFLKLASFLVLVSASICANAQSFSDEATLAKGRAFALLVCSACHVVASDQQFSPILRDPGPTFDAIANRPTTTSESLRTFLSTTHTTIGAPYGMPNPQLADYQINEVTSYILSLRSRH
jgi:mono/diheme cytochrome c family protein